MTTTDISAPRLQMSASDWARLLLLGAIWGASFFFARIAVAQMPPLVLVFWRVLIAAVALQLYLVVAGFSFSTALPRWRMLVLLAVANNIIPFSLIFIGQTQLGAGLASVLNATTPFWTLVFANAFTRDEKLTSGKLVGIGLGIIGTAIMIGPGVITNLGGPIWPKLALVGASISYACSLLVAKRLRDVPAPIIATAQLSASSLLMCPVVLLGYGAMTFVGASATVWSAVVALAILSTAFAYLLYFRIVADAGATNASLVTMIVPVSAILLGVIFLGETLDLLECLGIAVITLGLVTIDGRLYRRLRTMAG